MKTKIILLAIVSLISVSFLVSCGNKTVDDINYELLDNIDISKVMNGVVPLPSDLGIVLTSRFSKYTKHLAPNGKPIHIFAQSGVSDLQVVRAREILKFHLAEVPDAQYGANKIALANKMAENRATLIYTDTQENAFGMYKPLEKTKLKLQDLYATESPVEGSEQYMNNGPGRDASYEEIMHLVHAKGLEEILPDYHQEIVDAEMKAVDAGVFKYGRPAPHEYIITGFDLYYGLWEHNPQGNGMSFGEEYPYYTHKQLKENDPLLYDLVEDFWPPFLTYNAFIDPSFEGTFSLSLTDALAYTFKSQYLIQATLTGNKPSGLIGNNQDNTLTGNQADNSLIGGAGNDVIDGGEGIDVAAFTGKLSEYSIVDEGNKIIVSDKIKDRDGEDIITNIETLKFSDRSIEINKIERAK